MSHLTGLTTYTKGPTMHNTPEVKSTLKSFNGDVWNMMGPYFKGQRQTLMLAITGDKIPKAKCGVTAIHKALVSRLTLPPHSCPAQQTEHIRRWAQAS